MVHENPISHMKVESRIIKTHEESKGNHLLGSEGNYRYNKDVSKGEYRTHSQSPRDISPPDLADTTIRTRDAGDRESPVATEEAVEEELRDLVEDPAPEPGIPTMEQNWKHSLLGDRGKLTGYGSVVEHKSWKQLYMPSSKLVDLDQCLLFSSLR